MLASVVDELPLVENLRLPGAWPAVPSRPSRWPRLSPTRPPTVIEISCLYSWPLAAFTSSVVGRETPMVGERLSWAVVLPGAKHQRPTTTGTMLGREQDMIPPATG